jgi:hypothetical protein
MPPDCSGHLPGTTPRQQLITIHHGLGRGCGVGRGLGDGVDLGVTVGVGVAIGVGLGVTVGIGVGVAVGLGVGVGVTVGVIDGVGLGEHTLSTSTKRATVCWFPWSVVCTPVTRKPPSLLLGGPSRELGTGLCRQKRSLLRRAGVHQKTATAPKQY